MPVLLSVAIPCALEVIPWRKSRAEGRIIWKDSAVAVDEIDPSDAPPAFEISSSVFGRYSIRKRSDRLWWPLFVRGKALGRDDFIQEARRSDGCFLAAMNMSQPTLDAPRDAGRFDIDSFVGRVVSDTTDARLQLAQRVAAHFLCCDGIVHYEGGEPAYFAAPLDRSDQRVLMLRVGQLSHHANRPGDAWHPGLSLRGRLAAIRKAGAFSVGGVDVGKSELVEQGHSVVAADQVTSLGPCTSHPGIVHFCAEALATLIIRNAHAAKGLQDEIADILAIGRQERVSMHLVWREILSNTLHRVGDRDFERFFLIGAGRTRSIIAEIDEVLQSPTLTPEDTASLMNAIGNPA